MLYKLYSEDIIPIECFLLVQNNLVQSINSTKPSLVHVFMWWSMFYFDEKPSKDMWTTEWAQKWFILWEIDVR